MKFWEWCYGVLCANLKTKKITVDTRFEATGYTSMKNLPRLITAILRVYENPQYKPVIENGKVLTTYCNQAVREIAGMMDCQDFAGMSADQIYDFVRAGKGWKSILMRDAQVTANVGSLVIAALPSRILNEEHGHVCVVRPGEQVWSEHWKSNVPACVNIGGQNFILRYKTESGESIEAGVNGAFQIIPEFFVWEASL